MVNKEFWKSAFLDMWYLVILLLAIVLVVAYKIITGGTDTGPSNATGPAQVVGEQAAPTDAAPQPRQTEEEKARVIIADYQKRFDADPKHPDAPALLSAMGNLTMLKLNDHKEAARIYEVLLNDYPDWEMIGGVYQQLMTCYEQLENKDGLRWLYKQMIEKFPPESELYKYAQVHLND